MVETRWKFFYRQFPDIQQGFDWMMENVQFVGETVEDAYGVTTPIFPEAYQATGRMAALALAHIGVLRYYRREKAFAFRTRRDFLFGWTQFQGEWAKFRIGVPYADEAADTFWRVLEEGGWTQLTAMPTTFRHTICVAQREHATAASQR